MSCTEQSEVHQAHGASKGVGIEDRAGVARRGFLRRLLTVGAVLAVGREVCQAVSVWVGVNTRSVACAQSVGQAVSTQSCVEGQCLSTPELSLLEAITAVVIPSDEHGPGAKEAKVAELVHQSLVTNPALRQRYSDGLQAVDQLTRSRYSQGYTALPYAEQVELFTLLQDVKAKLWPEQAPETLIGRLQWKLNNLYYRRVVGVGDPALVLVDQVVRDSSEAFYATEVAWASLGYSGPPFPFGYVGRSTACGTAR